MVHHDEPRGFLKHGVEVGSVHACRAAFALAFHGRLRQFEGARVTLLAADVVVDFLHLGRIHEGALHTHGVVAAQEEHIALTHELVGAGTVENGAAVDLRHHLKGHTRREVCLNRTCDNVGRGALRGNHHVHAHGTRQLRDAGDGQFHFLAGSHDEVAELVDNHHDVWHILVPGFRVEAARLKLGVVFLDVPHLGFFEQVVAVIHELAEAFERLHHFRHVGDDGVFAVGDFGEEVVFNRGVHAKLHLLRVYHHEFQFGGVLLVEQRGDDGVQADRLTLTRGTGNEQVGHLGEVHHEGLVRNGLAEGDGQFVLRFLEFLRIENALHRHDARVLVRHLDADCAFAGNGRDDADAEGREREGDVVLEVSDFVDAHAGRGGHLVERNRGANRSLDARNLYAETAQHGDDAVLVGVLLRHVYRRAAVVVMLQEVERGEAIVFEVLAWVVGLHVLHFAHHLARCLLLVLRCFDFHFALSLGGRLRRVGIGGGSVGRFFRKDQRGLRLLVGIV